MKCQDCVQAIPMYLYGEVSPAVEEQVEDHVATCESCAEEMKRQQAVLAAIDNQATTAPAGLLQECRGDLTRRMAREPAHSRGWFGLGSWFQEIREQGLRLRIPVGAMAMLALGYLLARVPGPLAVGTNEAGVDSTPSFSAVRSIESQPQGTVRIALDEIRRRQITGRLDDENIQRLLLDASREENNPGVRVESVGMLKDCAQSSPVRQALLDAVAHDTNPGVRLKALEGLQAFAGDPAVRQTLAQVLLHDDNAGVRIQTIDVLTAHPVAANHDGAMVGILQDVFQKEDNHYVRLRVQNVLQEMHATAGTF